MRGSRHKPPAPYRLVSPVSHSILCLCAFHFRVSKTWHSIIEETQAWQVINFYDKGPVKENIPAFTSYFGFTSYLVPKQGKEPIRQLERWQFPRNEADVCEFLSRFAGVALQELHLPVMSKNIMNILRQNCPNIHILTYRHDHNEYPNLEKFVVSEDEMAKDVFYFPSNLRSIYIQAPSTRSRWSSDPWYAFEKFEGDETTRLFKRVCEDILNILSKCKSLNKIVLNGLWLSASGMHTLVTNTALKEIDIILCISDGFAFGQTSNLAEQDGSKRDMDDILASTIGSVPIVERFRIIGRVKHYNIIGNRFPKFCEALPKMIRCISQWKNLKVLALKCVYYSKSLFRMVIIELTHLVSLELDGWLSLIADLMPLIGTHLKKLEFLALHNGFTASRVGCLQSLCNHPNLKTLWLLYDFDLEGVWEIDYCRSIYDILVTLPKIRKVILRGLPMHQLFELRESYPGLESIEIEVQELPKDSCILHPDSIRMQYPL